MYTREARSRHLNVPQLRGTLVNLDLVISRQREDRDAFAAVEDRRLVADVAVKADLGVATAVPGVQVDVVVSGGGEELERVDPGAHVEQIAGAEARRVVARAAAERLGQRGADERVVAVAAVHDDAG